VAELAGRVGEQVLGPGHDAAEEVRDPAHAVRGEPAGLADHHAEPGRDPARGGSGGETRRGAGEAADTPGAPPPIPKSRVPWRPRLLGPAAGMPARGGSRRSG